MVELTKDPTEMSRHELEELNVQPELRTICRDLFGGGTWIAHASKKELVDAIVSRKTPDGERVKDQHLIKILSGEDAKLPDHPLEREIARIVRREMGSFKVEVKEMVERANVSNREIIDKLRSVLT